jgi:transmembrane sensor
MFFFFRSSERIRREAADWIARLDRDPSPELQRQFSLWRHSNPQHGQAYDRVAAIWSASSHLSRPGPLAERPDLQPVRYSRFALAACVALLIAAGVILPGLQFNHAQTAILATQLGEARQISLKDGSRIALSPNSEAMVSFTRSERRISLQRGRAIFQVSSESRPFVVEVDGHDVTGIGDRFEVSVDPLPAAVTPLEGAIEVRRHGMLSSLFGDMRRASPGQKLVLTDGGTRIEPVSSPSAMIKFDNMKLGEAIQRFNLKSRTKLKISGHASDFRLTGAYRAGDASGFARSLAAAFSLKIEPQPDGSLLLIAR